MKELELLKNKEFRFNKKFGQNFIFDLNFLNAIVNDAQVDKNSLVMEVGTGAGTLTRAIASKAKEVVTFEVDTSLKPFLEEAFKDFSNIDLHFQDILKVNLQDVEKNFDDKYVLIANLPYYITTPIIFKFLEDSKKIRAMYIMVQYEVAERLCAKAGSPEYGAITPAIEVMGDAKIIRKVSRKMFTPEPNVDSAMVEIKIRKKFNVEDKDLLKQVITSAFAMRRKTLVNNLKTSFSNLDFDWNKILLDMGLKESVRGETLTAEQFVNLANMIYNLKNKIKLKNNKN